MLVWGGGVDICAMCKQCQATTVLPALQVDLLHKPVSSLCTACLVET